MGTDRERVKGEIEKYFRQLIGLPGPEQKLTIPIAGEIRRAQP
jgi:hypothetical protein